MRRWSGRRRLAALALLACAAAPASAGSVGAAGDGAVDATFDWPVGCAVHVDQQYYDATTAIDATYDVTLTTVTADDVTAEFGPATPGDVVIEGVDDTDLLHDQLAAFLTNPTLAIDRDGALAEAVGLPEWLAGFRRVGPSADQYSDARLRREISYRSAVATWGTWVGLWADLAASGDLRDATLDDVDHVDEFGDHSSAALTVDVGTTDAGGLTASATGSLRGDDLARLWRNDYDPATATAVDYDPAADQWRDTVVTVATDPATLRPASASYEVTADLGTGDGAELVVAYDWTFDWGDCRDALPLSEAPIAVETSGAAAGPVVPTGFDTVAVADLPAQARETLRLIDQGGPFPYRQDGVVFHNREGILPDQPDGYYHEYTVETPGSDDRGARRLVVGADGVIFYTDDHYDSFQVVLR